MSRQHRINLQIYTSNFYYTKHDFVVTCNWWKYTNYTTDRTVLTLWTRHNTGFSRFNVGDGKWNTLPVCQMCTHWDEWQWRHGQKNVEFRVAGNRFMQRKKRELMMEMIRWSRGVTVDTPEINYWARNDSQLNWNPAYFINSLTCFSAVLTVA